MPYVVHQIEYRRVRSHQREAGVKGCPLNRMPEDIMKRNGLMKWNGMDGTNSNGTRTLRCEMRSFNYFIKLIIRRLGELIKEIIYYVYFIKLIIRPPGELIKNDS